MLVPQISMKGNQITLGKLQETNISMETWEMIIIHMVDHYTEIHTENFLM